MVRARKMERETGIEPATNGLGSRDSTAELLPHWTAVPFYQTFLVLTIPFTVINLHFV